MMMPFFNHLFNPAYFLFISETVCLAISVIRTSIAIFIDAIQCVTDVFYD